MPDYYEHYRVFLSSPGDVAAERQLATEAIAKINQVCGDLLQLSLRVRKWEDMAPVTPHLPEERIQDALNEEVSKCNFFILILYKRYGRIEPGHSISNTERELEAIMRCYEKNPHLKILAYFREIGSDDDPGLQEKQVREFRERLQGLGMFYQTYRTPEEFEDRVTHDLYSVIMAMRLSPFKQQALKTFWRFGQPEGETRPRVAVLYPPVQREFMGHPDDAEFWHKRLEPNIYFEDHKAIEKVRKTFALVGLRDYEVFPNASPPANLREMNRVWICMPRHKGAMEQLTRYRDVARFRVDRPSGKGPSSLLWTQPGGRDIRVHSPLAKYMEEQRSRLDVSGEWHGQLGRISGRDYAVLARFEDTASSAWVVGGTLLHDYFLAGIRGLGTWGAAWYIDRRYKALKEREGASPLQLLLEVQFRDDRIVDVVDVSEMDEAYFRDQNSISTIRRQIHESSRTLT